ncbi:uncharacterized protein METZ01_LOCUS361407, partial [marine metagenome]
MFHLGAFGIILQLTGFIGIFYGLGIKVFRIFLFKQ